MSNCNVAADGQVAADRQVAEAGGERTASDHTDNAILDAARDCVLAFGVRRTSLSDVARRAGVSRPTVYRRWPDRRALVADLMTRELADVFALARADDPGIPPGTAPDLSVPDFSVPDFSVPDFSVPDLSVRDFSVRQLVGCARRLRAHPLLAKIIDVDPEMLQPYIFDRLGTSQRMALLFIARLIRAGQRDGSIRAGDVDAMSMTMLLSVQSAVLCARPAASLITPAQHDAELALLLGRYLEPPAGPVPGNRPSGDGASGDGASGDGAPGGAA